MLQVKFNITVSHQKKRKQRKSGIHQSSERNHGFLHRKYLFQFLQSNNQIHDLKINVLRTAIDPFSIEKYIIKSPRMILLGCTSERVQASADFVENGETERTERNENKSHFTNEQMSRYA